MTTEFEANFIINFGFQKPGNYWIGLTDTSIEGSFTWANSGEALNFTAWAGNEPNGGVVENCVAITEDKTYFWSDENCQEGRFEPLCYSPFILNPCGNGWSYILETNGCYLVTDTSTATWQSCFNSCSSRGDGIYLVEITSEDEHLGIVQSVAAEGIVGNRGHDRL